jgi:hypothetical protein
MRPTGEVRGGKSDGRPCWPGRQVAGRFPGRHPRLDFFHLASRFEQHAIYEELPIGCCTQFARIERCKRVLFDGRARWRESAAEVTLLRLPRPRRGNFPLPRKKLPAVLSIAHALSPHCCLPKLRAQHRLGPSSCVPIKCRACSSAATRHSVRDSCNRWQTIASRLHRQPRTPGTNRRGSAKAQYTSSKPGTLSSAQRRKVRLDSGAMHFSSACRHSRHAGSTAYRPSAAESPARHRANHVAACSGE